MYLKSTRKPDIRSRLPQEDLREVAGAPDPTGVGRGGQASSSGTTSPNGGRGGGTICPRGADPARGSRAVEPPPGFPGCLAGAAATAAGAGEREPLQRVERSSGGRERAWLKAPSACTSETSGWRGKEEGGKERRTEGARVDVVCAVVPSPFLPPTSPHSFLYFLTSSRQLPKSPFRDGRRQPRSAPPPFPRATLRGGRALSCGGILFKGRERLPRFPAAKTCEEQRLKLSCVPPRQRRMCGRIPFPHTSNVSEKISRGGGRH